MVSPIVMAECFDMCRELETKNKPKINQRRDPVIGNDYGLIKLNREQLNEHPERSLEGVYFVTTLRYLSSNVDDLIDSTNFETEQLERELSNHVRNYDPNKKIAYTILDETSESQPDGSLLVRNEVTVHSIDKKVL
ncbi:hypothetical protein K8R47_04150 [archaeon]|nr:hypothetical protein [archaeon]